jgi:hypothetical protein
MFYLAGLPPASAQEPSTAARIFYNAKIFTAEPEHPYAEAVAIEEGKVVAVGSLLEVCFIQRGTHRFAGQIALSRFH